MRWHCHGAPDGQAPVVTNLSEELMVQLTTTRAMPRVCAAWKRASLAIVLFAIAACSDAPLAPSEKIATVDVERLMPSVVDALDRLAPQILNASVRERVTYDLQQLEVSLESADARNVRFHTVVTADILTEYVQNAVQNRVDGADVDAIRLMLFAVSQVVHAGVTFGSA
jgi:hypothetical protein